MATLYITEYANVAQIQGGVPIPQEPAIAEQTVSFTTATASSAFNSNTRLVRIVSDAECHLKFGAAPTATTVHQQHQADTPSWHGVTPGHKVSAVTAA